MFQQNLLFASVIALIVLATACSDDPVSGIQDPSGSTIDTVWSGKILAIEVEERLQSGSMVTCRFGEKDVRGFVSPIGRVVCIVPELNPGEKRVELSTSGLAFEFQVQVVPMQAIGNPRAVATTYLDRIVGANWEMGKPQVRSLVYAQNYFEVEAQLQTLRDLIDSADDSAIGALGAMIEINPQLFAMREVVGERLGSELYAFQGLPFGELYTAETNDIATKVFAADVLLTLFKHDYSEISSLAKWACKTGATTKAVFLRAMSQLMNRRPMVVSGLKSFKAYGRARIYNGRLTRCSFTTELRSLIPSDASASPTGKKLMESFEGFESLWQTFRSSFGDLQGDVFSPFSIEFFPTTYTSGYDDNTVVTAVRAIDDNVETTYQVHEDKHLIRITDVTLPKDTSLSKVVRLECELRVVDDVRILDTVVVSLNPYELVESIVPLEFVAIPPGTFLMGSENGELDEQPVHEVIISSGFEMSKYPITVEQYLQLLEEVEDYDFRSSDGISPNRIENFGPWELEYLPAYFNQRNDGYEYRLPTEAEWEYACRAGATTTYFWGDDYDMGAQYHGSFEVGDELPNAFGLYGMIGGHAEVASDHYDADFYSRSPLVDPVNGYGPEIRRGASCSARDHTEEGNLTGALRLVRIRK